MQVNKALNALCRHLLAQGIIKRPYEVAEFEGWFRPSREGDAFTAYCEEVFCLIEGHNISIVTTYPYSLKVFTFDEKPNFMEHFFDLEYRYLPKSQECLPRLRK